MKRCNKCLQNLDESKFGRHSGANFLRPECKKCNNQLNKERYAIKIKYGDPPPNYKCPICLRGEEQVKGLGGKRIGPWVRDHDHGTDIFRGWLCHPCNRSIGGFHDDINKLKRARLYLSPPKWWEGRPKWWKFWE
ncbi:MAG TPA: hypothetical protein EYN64_00985 [Flavobacteriales bacterium]|nr:hypothetical protein [Flavobacteriales bacterium]